MLLNLEEERITIAIDEPSQDLLGVTAGLAFLPELLTRTAPIVHVACLDGMTEGVLVHPSHHEHASTRCGTLLHNGRNEPSIIIFKIQIHPHHIEAAEAIAQEDS